MISWKKSTNSFWMTEWGDIHIVLKTDTSAEWSCSHGLPRAPVFGSEKYMRIIYMPPPPPPVQNHVSPHAIITSDDWLKNRPLSIAETLTLLSLTSLLKECQPLTTSTKPQLEKKETLSLRAPPPTKTICVLQIPIHLNLCLLTPPVSVSNKQAHLLVTMSSTEHTKACLICFA